MRYCWFHLGMSTMLPHPHIWKQCRDGFINWTNPLTPRGQMLQFIHLIFQHTHLSEHRALNESFWFAIVCYVASMESAQRCHCLWLHSRWSAFLNPPTPMPLSTCDALSNCWGLVHVTKCPSFTLYAEPVL